MTPRGDKAFLEALGWGGPNLWLTAVPEPEVAKNRVYLDLRAPDSDVAAEVARLQGLGATVLRDGTDLVVMLDPAATSFASRLDDTRGRGRNSTGPRAQLNGAAGATQRGRRRNSTGPQAQLNGRGGRWGCRGPCRCRRCGPPSPA